MAQNTLLGWTSVLATLSIHMYMYSYVELEFTIKANCAHKLYGMNDSESSCSSPVSLLVLYSCKNQHVHVVAPEQLCHQKILNGGRTLGWTLFCLKGIFSIKSYERNDNNM